MRKEKRGEGVMKGNRFQKVYKPIKGNEKLKLGF